MSPRAGLLIITALILALAGAAMLAGCAREVFKGTCAIQPIGQDERGLTVIRYYCEPQ